MTCLQSGTEDFTQTHRKLDFRASRAASVCSEKKIPCLFFFRFQFPFCVVLVLDLPLGLSKRSLEQVCSLKLDSNSINSSSMATFRHAVLSNQHRLSKRNLRSTAWTR